MLKKMLCAGLAAALLVAVTGCGGSKDKGSAGTKAKWPKNVEVVVPYGAGGDTDFNARLLSQKLSKKLGTNIVVSNIKGNGGRHRIPESQGRQEGWQYPAVQPYGLCSEQGQQGF